MIHWNEHGQLIRANDKFTQQTGYSQEELLGSTLKSLTYADDVEKSHGVFQKLRHGDIDNHLLEKSSVKFLMAPSSRVHVDEIRLNRFGNSWVFNFILLISNPAILHIPMIEAKGPLRS